MAERGHGAKIASDPAPSLGGRPGPEASGHLDRHLRHPDFPFREIIPVTGLFLNRSTTCGSPMVSGEISEECWSPAQRRPDGPRDAPNSASGPFTETELQLRAPRNGGFPFYANGLSGKARMGFRPKRKIPKPPVNTTTPQPEPEPLPRFREPSSIGSHTSSWNQGVSRYDNMRSTPDAEPVQRRTPLRFWPRSR